MRLLTAVAHDIRYQAKYGFYLLYTIISAIYVAVLLVCPGAYQSLVASVIVLTDPAMLGTFFIGGIWLLEKGEGLHRFWLVSPLRPAEYIAAKALSLALISAVSADAIVLAAMRTAVNYPLLTVAVLAGSFTFTVIGLLVASYARSVNQYMLLAAPLEVFIALPPVLAAFGASHPAFNLLPGMAVWQLIRRALGLVGSPPVLFLAVVILAWMAAAVVLACKRIPRAMQTETGGLV